MTSLLLNPGNLLTGNSRPSAAALSIIARLKSAMARARQSNLLINSLYSGAATLTQASAVDSTTTQDVDPYTKASRILYKNGKVTGAANSVQVYAIQNLAGATLYNTAIEFYTDATTLTLSGRRQSSAGFRVAINDQYVTSSSVTAWSTSVTTYNYLVIAGLSGTNKIRLEWQSNFVFEHLYTTPLASVWAPPADIVAAVVGDSYTSGSGASYVLDSFAFNLEKLAGLDVVFPLGYSGTGYAASLTGTSFTGTTTAGSTTVSVSNTTGLAAGQPIMAAGTGGESPYIPRHTKIVSVVSNTSITLDTAANASVTDGTFFAASAALTPTDYQTKSTSLTRLENDFKHMPRYPDVIFFLLGLNDDANGAGYDAVIKSTYALARQLCPDALIVNLGVPHTAANGGNSGSPNYVSSYSYNNENKSKNVVSSFNDPMMINVPNSTDANAGIGNSWFWGDGKTTSTTGHGNTDLYIGSDGTHPVSAGHLFLAKKAVAGLGAVLAGM